MTAEKCSYVALPAGKSPRICFDPCSHESIKSAFELYRPHSLKGKLLRLAGIVLSYTRLIARFSFFRVTPDVSGKLAEYDRQLGESLELGDITTAYLLGTPGKHQKWIARISANNSVTAYAKIAFANGAAKQLVNEAKVLARLEAFSSKHAHVPRLIASVFSDDLSFIVVSGPGYDVSKTSKIKLDKSLAGFTRELALHGKTAERHVDEILDRDFSIKGTPRIELARLRIRDWLVKTLPEGKYQIALSHGDFAPWNVLTQTNNKYFVFDWEYSSETLPAFFDIFHYAFMPAMLVDNKAPVLAIGRCLAMCQQGAPAESLSSDLTIKSEHLPAYLGLYLWSLLIRLADTQEKAAGDGIYNSTVEYVIRAIEALSFRFNRRKDKPAVLVSAYACDPEHGSEPGVGWQMVQAISRIADEWVITRKNNRNNIERELLATRNLHVYLSAIDLPPWLGWWKKGQRGVRTYYYLWQLVALYHCRKELSHKHFDIGHHVTFVNDWLFTFFSLYKLPYIWGPIGSHPKIPYGLTMNLSAYLKDRARYLFQGLMRTIDPLFWLSATRASKIVVISNEARNRWPLLLFKKKTEVHTGIGVEEFTDITEHGQARKNGSTTRILSVGRLVPIKGFNLAIESFSRVGSDIDLELVIIGKGPDKEKLEQLVKKTGNEAKVRFIEWLPRDQVMQWFATADIFLFPSFEAGGMVVLEAMNQSVPVVCLDYAGPGTMVDETSGIKIPIGSKRDVVTGLSSAIRTLVDDKEKYDALSQGARQRVREQFMWGERYNIVNEWYSEVAGATGMSN
ncbi:MAG TPA: glycosyltransferase [Gammaproteobacteria bacterium]|nr:glycosyltransferase [Gammaproteobacteria bacterium]